MKHLLLMIFVLVVGSKIYGQDKLDTNSPIDSVGLEYHLNAMTVLNLLQELGNLTRLKNDIDIYRYNSMFTGKAQIINEALPANKLSSTGPVHEIVNDMADAIDGNFRVYSFRPYSLVIEKITDSLFIYGVMAFKEIGQTGRDGHFYRDTLNLYYRIHFNTKTKSALIDSVGLIESPPSYLTIQMAKQDWRDTSNLIINGQRVHQSGSSLILKVDSPEFEYHISPLRRDYIGSIKVKGQKSELGDNGTFENKTLKLKLRPKRFHMKFQFGMAQLKDTYAPIPNEIGINEQQQLLDWKVGIGYTHFFNEDISISLTGMYGQQHWNGSYQMAQYFSSYESIDIDGEAYEHKTDLFQLDEQLSLNFQQAGGQLSLGYRIWPTIHVRGHYAYYSTFANLGTYSIEARADYYGVYSQYQLSLYELEAYGFYSNAVLSESNQPLEVSSGNSIQGFGAGIEYELSNRISILLDWQYLSQTTQMQPISTGVLSSVKDHSDASLTQLSNPRMWGYHQLSFGTLIYL